MLTGIDVSSCQGIITSAQWSAIAARGTKFAIAKAATGNDGKDPRFDQNIAAARAAGLVVGAYAFAYPLPTVAGHLSRDPIAQAQSHWEAMDGLGARAGELPPCCDLEWPMPGPDWTKWGVTAASIRAWALAYLAKMEALAGVTPLLYTFPFFGQAVGFTPEFARYPLFAAEYSVLAPIKPWAGFAVLQTAGGSPQAMSRRFQQPTNLPNGVPVDTDAADETIFAQLLQRAA